MALVLVIRLIVRPHTHRLHESSHFPLGPLRTPSVRRGSSIVFEGAPNKGNAFALPPRILQVMAIVGWFCYSALRRIYVHGYGTSKIE